MGDKDIRELCKSKVAQEKLLEKKRKELEEWSKSEGKSELEEECELEEETRLHSGEMTQHVKRVYWGLV